MFRRRSVLLSDTCTKPFFRPAVNYQTIWNGINKTVWTNTRSCKKKWNIWFQRTLFVLDTLGNRLWRIFSLVQYFPLVFLNDDTCVCEFVTNSSVGRGTKLYVAVILYSKPMNYCRTRAAHFTWTRVRCAQNNNNNNHIKLVAEALLASRSAKTRQRAHDIRKNNRNAHINFPRPS